MYDFVRGRVVKKTPTALVLEAGGVGFLLEASLRTTSALVLGTEALVLAHHWQREDQVRLFGFATEEERELFRRLIRVSGIGPAHALALLSAFAPDQIWRAIRDGDVKRLSQSRGIGGRIAQRLVTELGDEAKRKLPVRAGATGAAAEPGELDGISLDAAEALVVLGFPETAARRAVEAVAKRLGGDATVDSLVREALKEA